jgi:hypothetical protein
MKELNAPPHHVGLFPFMEMILLQLFQGRFSI